MSHRTNNSEQPLELTDRASSSSYPATPNMNPAQTEVALGQQGLQPTYAIELGLESIPHVSRPCLTNVFIKDHNLLTFLPTGILWNNDEQVAYAILRIHTYALY